MDNIVTMPYQYIFFTCLFTVADKEMSVAAKNIMYLFIYFQWILDFFSSRKVPLILKEKWFIVTPLVNALKLNIASTTLKKFRLGIIQLDNLKQTWILLFWRTVIFYISQKTPSLRHSVITRIKGKFFLVHSFMKGIY